MRRGFTLLEVVVALAILGLALMAIFDLNSGAVASHAYAKRLTVATMLARSKMTDLEQELYDKGFDARRPRAISGDFRAEGWEAFTWKAQILAPRTTDVSPDKLIDALFNLPPGKDGVSGLAALLGGGRDGGVGGAAGKPQQSLVPAHEHRAAGGEPVPLPPGATQASGLAALGPFATLAQTQMTQLLQTDPAGRARGAPHRQLEGGQAHRERGLRQRRLLAPPGLGPERHARRRALEHHRRPRRCPGAPGAAAPGQNPFRARGVNTGGQTIFGGPARGNIPPGTPLDPSGRPIR